MEHGLEVHLGAQTLGEVWGLPVTNSLLMGWIVVLLLVLFSFAVSRKVALVPGKFQTVVESGLIGYRDFAAQVFGSKEEATRWLPLLATLVLFIMTGNLIEFIPGVESILFVHGTESVPLLRSLNADLNMTLVLAVVAFVSIEVAGIRRFGWGYFSRFINFHSFIGFFVGLIELLSELIRLVSFSFRLFGNVFAGGMLIAVITFFVPYFLPSPFLLFETFIGILQAVVFSLLTLFFLKLALTEAEH